MTTTSLSSDTKITIKDFVNKVMKPATRSTESSIIKNYDSRDPVRAKHSYGHLEGGEIVEAIKRYPGKMDVTVAQRRINDIAEAQARIKSRKLDIEMNTRGGSQPSGTKAQNKKAEIKQMRSKLKDKQKEKIKKEMEMREKKMLSHTKKPSRSVEDMPID